MRIRPSSVVVLLSALVLLGACTSDGGSPQQPRGPETVDDGLAEELEEREERTERRLEALQAARAAGTLGITERITRLSTPGWAGERIVNDRGDDWEPAIAADPSGAFVYILHNRFGGDPACPNSCPDPAMILHVSPDGGRTWRPERYLCTCRTVQGQWDPLIEVVPETGEVYAVWMNDFDIQFSKSDDNGRNWSTPVPIYGRVAWGDKPNFATSADGQDVYVLFNGPTNGDVYAAYSHDAGETWSQVQVTDSERYYFAYGTAVLPDGRALSTQISFTYSGPAAAAEGVVMIHVLASDDGGETWTDTVVDTLELGSHCTSELCYADFYDSGPALAADEDGDLVIVYSGAREPEGPRTVYARSSTDGGRTWSDRVRLSPSGENAAFAAAAGFGNDDAKIYFADQRTGRWNVWYRSTNDLGATWSPAVRISDATSGARYKNAKGFLEFYGDYGEIAVTSSGDAVAVWGEGESFLGPGGVWFNREL
jgi:hypothetical protein